MDSFENPVGSQPRDPYEHYRVEPVEADKLEKEKYGKGAPPEASKKLALAAYLAVLLRHFIELFERTFEKGLSTKAEEEIRGNLLLLKASLDTLKTEDRSQDVNFLNRLADFWHVFLEDSRRLKKKSPLALQTADWIRVIQNFPPDQEHTLGYYLTEHAGEKWIPFPYMEMIHRLHAAHQKNPTSSSLELWGRKLQELIDSLKPSGSF